MLWALSPWFVVLGSWSVRGPQSVLGPWFFEQADRGRRTDQGLWTDQAPCPMHEGPTSSWLSHHIDERGLAALDDGDRAPDRRTEVAGVGDRTFRVHAKSLGELREIDERIL